MMNSTPQGLSSATTAFLASLAGTWQGTNRTWFQPGILADESPILSSFRGLPDSRYVLHEYFSSIEGKPFHGMALYGYNDFTQRIDCAWADGFHMSQNMMFASGEALPGGFWVLGSYADPNGGPSWGWRTELRLIDGDNLTITAYNITPQGEGAKAVEATLNRIKDSMSS